MSFEGLFVLLPVLFFALAGTAIVRAMRRRRRNAKTSTYTATIVSSRLGENSIGSVTQYYPIIDVNYQRDGQIVTAANLPVARESRADLAAVKAVIAGPYSPGKPIAVIEDPAQPGRVSVA